MLIAVLSPLCGDAPRASKTPPANRPGAWITRYHPVQPPQGPSRPVTGPAVPPYCGSGGRLREQLSTGLPHRLAASAGSLEAGVPVFLPIQVFLDRLPALFYGEFPVLSRGGGKSSFFKSTLSTEISTGFFLDKIRQSVYYKGTITHYIGNFTERTAFPWS